MLRAAIEGIKARGNADLGDKTLLDALVPPPTTIEEQAKAGSTAGGRRCAAAAVTARSAAEATRPMLAKRGRATYTGERSIGSLDAGAVAVAVMVEALADAWREPTQPIDDRGGTRNEEVRQRPASSSSRRCSRASRWPTRTR